MARSLPSLPVHVAAFAGAVVVLGAGCPAADCNAVEPLYAGDASDEVWREMLDARVDAVEGGDAATFTSPDPSSVFADEPPTFAWESPLKVAVLRPSSRPVNPRPRHRSSPSLLDRLSAAVLPAARAHLPPVTSDVYFLEIDVPGRTCPVSALTTELSFTFSDGDWAKVVDGDDDGRAEPGERTARLMSAFLVENNVTEGPFLAEPLSFTLASR